MILTYYLSKGQARELRRHRADKAAAAEQYHEANAKYRQAVAELAGFDDYESAVNDGVQFHVGFHGQTIAVRSAWSPC
jgi:hypothetical protein